MTAKQKTKWLRSEDYLAWVRTLPCVISEDVPCVAHHAIGNGRCGTERTHDYWAFPLTDVRHKELHQYGWPEWERNYGSQWQYAAETLLYASSVGLFEIVDEVYWCEAQGFIGDYDITCQTYIDCIERGAIKLNKKTAQGRNNIL